MNSIINSIVRFKVYKLMILWQKNSQSQAKDDNITKLNWAHIGSSWQVLPKGWIWKFTSEKQFLTWINACILIWQSQWLSYILTNGSSNQNVILQTQIKPCKFGNETREDPWKWAANSKGSQN
jgi:hypothetical protein